MYPNKLKEIRVNNSLTQNDVANILGVNRSSYANWELGLEIIPVKRLDMFSSYFKISIDYILSLNNDNYTNINKININKLMLRLKEFRKENNLTQEKLAIMLNTDHSVIANYERGRTIISTGFLYMISKKYNISCDYLLGKTDNIKYIKEKIAN